MHITYPQISWSCSQISPLPQGLHHRDGALVLRSKRQGRSRSWRGRSLVPTNPLGCHLALNWAWWLATCLEKMAVSIGKMLITIKSGGKPFSDKPIWCYEHLFKNTNMFEPWFTGILAQKWKTMKPLNHNKCRICKPITSWNRLGFFLGKRMFWFQICCAVCFHLFS